MSYDPTIMKIKLVENVILTFYIYIYIYRNPNSIDKNVKIGRPDIVIKV